MATVGGPAKSYVGWLAAFTAAFAIASLGAQTSAEPLESLKVYYDATMCAPIDGGHVNLYAPIDASLRGISTHSFYQEAISPRSDPRAAEATFHVVPDAYYVEGFQQKTQCSTPAGMVEIVLPGHPASTKTYLANCCGDAVAASYVAGLVPPNVGVEIMRLPSVLPCGASVDEHSLQKLPSQSALRRIGNAYRAAILELGAGTLIMEVWDETRKGFLQLSLADNGTVSTTSSYKRLDITEDLLQQASSRQNTLFCYPATASR